MLTKHLATLAVLFLTAIGYANADQPKPDDAAKMQGVWIAEKVTFAGRDVPSAKFPFELHFEKSKLTFKFVGKITGKDRVHKIVLDSSKTPSTIDITREIRDEEVTVRGIYKFQDGKLMICSLRGPDRRPSLERPKTFESSKTVTSDLLILKRKPEADE